MKAVVALVLIIVVVVVLYFVWKTLREGTSHRARVETFPDHDDLVVAVVRGDTLLRTVKRLPRAMDSVDFKVEYDLAMEEAKEVCESINGK